MKRAYLVIPLLMAGSFLAYYVWWNSRETERFLSQGPGRLRHTKSIYVNVPLRKLPPGQTRIDFYGSQINDQQAIASIITVVSPDQRDWTISTTRMNGGVLFWFLVGDKQRIEIRMGEDFIICGPYSRRVPPEMTAAIREMLIRAGAE